MRKFISTIIVRGFCGKPNVMNLIKEICNPKIRQQIPSSKLLAQCSEFCSHYKNLEQNQRQSVLKELAVDFGLSKSDVVRTCQPISDTQDNDLFIKSAERLTAALKPNYYPLLRSIGHLEGGVKFLSDMRSDILDCMSSTSDKDIAKLKHLDGTVMQLLSLWFSVGLLKLERVSWTSSCDLVEKLADYEAVHPFRNWNDAKRRMGSYRRCFAYLHPAMPGEPIIIVHVALLPEIVGDISKIVQGEVNNSDEAEVTDKIKAAIFYSITSTQKGLKGIDLGNFLIKQVVKELKSEFPTLDQFSTLSPIPNFVSWLTGELNCAIKDSKHGLYLQVFESLKNVFGVQDMKITLEKFKTAITESQWQKNDQLRTHFEPILMHLCAHYLFNVKHRGYVFDPVGNFHLRNGAVLWRLNFLADKSIKGMKQSCGIMANYRYYVDVTDRNSQTYLTSGLVQIEESVLKLVNAQNVSAKL